MQILSLKFTILLWIGIKMVFRTKDLESVSKILNHPDVYSKMFDDATPEPIKPAEGFYIINQEHTGVVRVDRMNGICCSVHIATLPELWGKAYEFTIEALGWGFENTSFIKIIAIIPEFNRPAMCLCSRCGFQREGWIKKSFLKRWELHDQILFGLNKSDFMERC